MTKDRRCDRKMRKRVRKQGKNNVDILSMLRKKGYRITGQRKIVIDEVMKRKGHITAIGLFNKLREKHPEIGLSTVYNTMHMLERTGLANKIEGVSRTEVFDLNVRPHLNFICPVCGRVEDAMLSTAFLSRLSYAASRIGFDRTKMELSVRSPCSAHRKS
ncbi:MAG: Fur family transcriptional regulator [Methanomassiliicoccales archaeon]